MKVKKWVLGLVAFAAMVVICAVCAGAERYGDFEYSLYYDGAVGIISYHGSSAILNIPAKINGKPVKYISENSFHNITTLKSVKIPDGVTFIGYNAFEGCTSLSVVTIPDSVTAICGDAFKNTAILAKQTTPVKYVGNWAVQSDKNAKSVTLKAGTVGVANETFEACSALTKVTLSTNIRYIGSFAFSECASLTSISIPEGVTEIPYEAFGNCTSLKNVTLPKTLKTIADFAFSQCTSLQNISIPDSVIEVGVAAFFDTAIIKKQKTDVKYVDKWAVDCDESAESVTLKSDIVGIANNAFQGCGLSSISIPKSVDNIGKFAFESCGLEDIVIPTKVKAIKYATFANCNSLKTVITLNNPFIKIFNRCFLIV